jgi:hypothetical protein
MCDSGVIGFPYRVGLDEILRTLWQVSSRYPSDLETTEMGIQRTTEYEIMKPLVQHELGNSAAR